jgi:hypothetical protein
MPTSEHEDDGVEELYGIIEEILEEDGKGNTNTIIMGDWNSVVTTLQMLYFIYFFQQLYR